MLVFLYRKHMPTAMLESHVVRRSHMMHQKCHQVIQQSIVLDRVLLVRCSRWASSHCVFAYVCLWFSFLCSLFYLSSSLERTPAVKPDPFTCCEAGPWKLFRGSACETRPPETLKISRFQDFKIGFSRILKSWNLEILKPGVRFQDFKILENRSWNLEILKPGSDFKISRFQDPWKSILKSWNLEILKSWKILKSQNARKHLSLIHISEPTRPY